MAEKKAKSRRRDEVLSSSDDEEINVKVSSMLNEQVHKFVFITQKALECNFIYVHIYAVNWYF